MRRPTLKRDERAPFRAKRQDAQSRLERPNYAAVPTSVLLALKHAPAKTADLARPAPESRLKGLIVKMLGSCAQCTSYLAANQTTIALAKKHRGGKGAFFGAAHHCARQRKSRWSPVGVLPKGKHAGAADAAPGTFEEQPKDPRAEGRTPLKHD